MNILLLGGTSDAIRLARKIIDLDSINHQFNLTYSIAGTVRKPDLDCEVISGGFSQFAALQDGKRVTNCSQIGFKNYIIEHHIDCVVDCTHPYATQITTTAFLVCKQLTRPHIVFNRQSWSASEQDNWITAKNWQDAKELLSHFQRPFVTIGQSAVKDTDEIQDTQFWLIRSAIADPIQTLRFKIIRSIGPFDLNNELTLMKQHQTDVLVCKNSGGKSVDSKLQAARQLKIPVIILERPTYSAEMRSHFRDDITAVFEELKRQSLQRNL